MQAKIFPYRLAFKVPGGTSRGVMHTRDTTYIKIFGDNKEIFGWGECAPLTGLSIDDVPDYQTVLENICSNIDHYLQNKDELRNYPSILFGIETAMLDLAGRRNGILFESEFTKGNDAIDINGLIWMGSKEDMEKQVKDKIDKGFRVIKLKVGAINFADELNILKWIRSEYKHEQLILRLDANGAFTPEEVYEKLKRLSDLDIHSIEQPIKAGQIEALTALAASTPIPVALDEELIPVTSLKEKENLLATIKPQFIILKPSLHGGILGCNEWMGIAKKQNIGWWITSALESNIGLNAIAQYTYSLDNPVTHGLGTGGLFTNNFDSPLYIREGHLYFDPEKSIEYPALLS